MSRPIFFSALALYSKSRLVYFSSGVMHNVKTDLFQYLFYNKVKAEFFRIDFDYKVKADFFSVSVLCTRSRLIYFSIGVVQNIKADLFILVSVVYIMSSLIYFIIAVVQNVKADLFQFCCYI